MAAFLILVQELLWWLFTLALAALIQYPIWRDLDYKFHLVNTVFIVVMLTYFRYNIFIKSLRFLRPSVVKYVLFTGNVMLFFFLLTQVQKLTGMWDNFILSDFGLPKMPVSSADEERIMRYIYTEVTIFGTGSMLMLLVFQLRLILVYWKSQAHRLQG